MNIDQIYLENNVVVEARERGKLRRDLCREGKNIWLYEGRKWVVRLMSYIGPTGPPNPAENNRVNFIGFGIGGDQQNISPLPVALDTDYPGTNLQNDADPTIIQLERPVRIDVSPSPTGTFYWLRQVTYAVAPARPEYIDPPPTTAVRYYAAFNAGEINTIGGTSYPLVPLSEIGLFHYGWNGTNGERDTMANVYPTGGTGAIRPSPLAYHTFQSIAKTTSIELTVRWEVRVGG